MIRKAHYSVFLFQSYCLYTEQEPQLLDEQPLQELVLPEAPAPSELLQNKEIALGAACPQSGQAPGFVASLIGLNCSNLRLQFEQIYSYIGIYTPFRAVRLQLPL